MNAYEGALAEDWKLAGLTNTYLPSLRADEDNEGLSMGIALICASYYLVTGNLGLAQLCDCVTTSGRVDSGTMAGAAAYMAISTMNPTDRGEVVAASLRLVKANRLFKRLGVSFQVRKVQYNYHLCVRPCKHRGTTTSVDLRNFAPAGWCDAISMATTVSFQAAYVTGLDGMVNYEQEREMWEARIRSVPQGLLRQLYVNPQLGNSVLADLTTMDEQNRWGEVLMDIQHSR